ncbi:MAG: sulfite exporter TauE/SafE family protein, partial [Deltaproteobacteria bacterium HGW-Deltaproteobacteria-20]
RIILEMWGQAGSDLYVSLSFVFVLVFVGGYVMKDAIKCARCGGVEETTALATRLQKIELWPMINFPRSGLRISLWFTLPVGFATGMLAATIAVGGFVGVPGLMASATELVIAFAMGLGGSINWAMHGMVDIRLVLIILGGSLLGVQLGAIGTTYVRPHMIKMVMATIMLIVAVSRGLALPTYLVKLNVMELSDSTLTLLKTVSFSSMCLALLVGSVIILGSMWNGRKAQIAAAS